MRGVDTNVLARRLTLIDDEWQHALAVRFAEGQRLRGEPLFITIIALCELVWVLENQKRLSRTRVAVALRQLVESELVVFDRPAPILAALGRF